MSYAAVAASGPKQTPEEAAAPQPPEIIPNESASSTASLIDVDAPSVHTVPSDFLEQEIQTETQAARIEREDASREAKAKAAADRAKAKGKKADNWIVNQFSRLSDGSVGAIALANLAGVVGLSAFLGYKAWGLYDRGRLSWEKVGLMRSQSTW